MRDGDLLAALLVSQVDRLLLSGIPLAHVYEVILWVRVISVVLLKRCTDSMGRASISWAKLIRIVRAREVRITNDKIRLESTLGQWTKRREPIFESTFLSISFGKNGVGI
jgi:hypothetical protein